MTTPHDSMVFHRLAWADLDLVARGEVGLAVIQRLRAAERSRRLLLLRALLDEVSKKAELFGPLPSPEEAWDLLARVEARSPQAFEEILSHPYTGSWAGHALRLFRDDITGPWPPWVHIGHMHALAAAAAVRARIPFHARVPCWNGVAVLPSLGAARLPVDEQWTVAEIRGGADGVELRTGDTAVRLPQPIDLPAPDWWPLRRIASGDHACRLSVRLDDVDPFRGLYEPLPPERIETAEVSAWQANLDDAWRLVATRLPHLAESMPAGLCSIVPRPVVLFRNASASTGEAFGSAIIGRQPDSTALAATLVHEFNHIVLGGVFHLTRLCEDDPRMRFYAPWRDDPRPLDRVLQGVYAHLGVTEFWRALSRADDRPDGRKAAVEFAYWREQTWRVATAIRGDESLTRAGRRFVDGIVSRFEPWLQEPIPAAESAMAKAMVMDHYAGWRLRHVRPRPELVGRVTEAWLAGWPRPPVVDATRDPVPTPVPDGEWSPARVDLIRLGLDPVPFAAPHDAVPDATEADLAYAAGRLTEAVDLYRAELIEDPDHPPALVGLGLSRAARGVDSAGRALLSHPELVRAVHRNLRSLAHPTPTPEELAAWIGTMVH
jgi:HEXXH motif-containing protein